MFVGEFNVAKCSSNVESMTHCCSNKLLWYDVDMPICELHISQ